MFVILAAVLSPTVMSSMSSAYGVHVCTCTYNKTIGWTNLNSKPQCKNNQAAAVHIENLQYQQRLLIAAMLGSVLWNLIMLIRLVEFLLDPCWATEPFDFNEELAKIIPKPQTWQCDC